MLKDLLVLGQICIVGAARCFWLLGAPQLGGVCSVPCILSSLLLLSQCCVLGLATILHSPAAASAPALPAVQHTCLRVLEVPLPPSLV